MDSAKLRFKFFSAIFCQVHSDNLMPSSHVSSKLTKVDFLVLVLPYELIFPQKEKYFRLNAFQ